jgi:hypothetical protein
LQRIHEAKELREHWDTQGASDVSDPLPIQQRGFNCPGVLGDRGHGSEERRRGGPKGSAIEPWISPEECCAPVPENDTGGRVEEILDLRLNLEREVSPAASSHPSQPQPTSTQGKPKKLEVQHP